jgi:hypothetical protein
MTDIPLIRAVQAFMLRQSGADDFDALDVETQESLLEAVKAAALAMRKPSDAMIRAGLTLELAGGRRMTELEAMLVWERMLDAALSE